MKKGFLRKLAYLITFAIVSAMTLFVVNGIKANEQNEIMEKLDFSSKCLIVETEDVSELKGNYQKVSGKENLYLVTYESEEETKDAYVSSRLNNKIKSVEVNKLDVATSPGIDGQNNLIVGNESDYNYVVAAIKDGEKIPYIYEDKNGKVEVSEERISAELNRRKDPLNLVGAGIASTTKATTVTLTQPTTLQANAQENTYTINFYQGNGSTTAGATLIGSQTFTFTERKALTTYANTTGVAPNTWTFAGWSTTPDGTTVTYADGYNNPNAWTTTNGANINLYAVFKRNITFISGQNKPAASTSTVEQRYNPYTNSNVTAVTAPTLTAISNWTATGYRNDTTAAAATVTASTTATGTVTPAYNSTATTYYGVYTRKYTATFYSGANKAKTTTKESNLSYYNSNSASLPTTVSIVLDSKANSQDISGWNELGWRDDTTAGAQEYAYGATATVPWNTNFYSVYSNTYSVTFLSGVHATTSSSLNGTVYYNTNTTTVQTTTTITLKTAADSADIENWTETGWRDDTTTGAKEYNYGQTGVTVAFGSTTFYSIYTRNYTANFYSGVNKATVKTITSNTVTYNTNTQTLPTTTTITLDTQANSTDISGWTERGWRDDTTTGDREYTYGQANVSVPWDTNFYSVYNKAFTANFYSGVYKATNSDVSGTVNYNTNTTTLPTTTTITTPNVVAITDWSKLGWRDDTTTGAAEYGEGASISVPIATSNFYGVYNRAYTANFYSGVNHATNTPVTGTVGYNSNTQTLPTTTTITLKTANDSANITNWTEEGWRDDTTDGDNEYTYGQTNVTVQLGTSNFYSTYSRTLTVTYNGNGATGGSTANSTATVYMNTNDTTTGAQTVQARANGFTWPGHTAVTPVWNTAANGSGTAVAANANYTVNPAIAYNASSFTSTLYAQWDANNYTIEYYQGNNSATAGSTKIGESSHTYGVAKNLTTYANTTGTAPSTWTFAGWSTAQDGTTVNYTDGQSVSDLSNQSGAVIKLYAVFKRNITFKSGVNGATTSTAEQRYNPYKTTGYLTEVTAPKLTAINGWTATGYRNDTTAGAATVTASTTATGTVTPTYNQTALTYYGIYTKEYTANFYSGVNKATNKPITGTAYYNSNATAVPTTISITLQTQANSTDISGWTERGWRDDTTTGDREYTYAQANVSVTIGTSNFYSVYSRSYTATFYSGVNKATTKTKTSDTSYYNTNTASLPTNATITLDTEANAAAITNWTKVGWRDDTTTATKEYNYGQTGVSVPWGTNFYSVYSRSYTATFYSGVNKATTTTKASDTSYYNTNTETTPTNATITLDTAANCAAITNWTKSGWRDDTTASAKEYNFGQTGVSVPWGTNFYAIYTRNYTATFNSGVHNEQQTTKASSTVNYNTNGASLPTTVSITLDTAANSKDISGWTELGWRDDTNTGTQEYAYAATATVPWGTNFYSVYSKDYVANFYSGVNHATNTPVSGTVNYNTNTETVPTTVSITLKTANDSANITNWTELGWRDDTTAAAKEYNYGQTGVSVALGTSNFYSVYSRVLTLSYDGNGADGGSTADSTATIYLNANSTTTSSQTITTRANGYTYTGHTGATPVWNTQANGSGTAVAAGSGFNPGLAYNASSFTAKLYAQWNANEYTIEYYQGNNSTTAGSTKIGESTHTYGVEKSLTTYANTTGTAPSTWTFAGWSTSQGGTTVNYTDGQSVTNLATTGTVKLYAVFKRNVTFISGVNKPAASTTTLEQRYNPYRRTGYLTSVTAPALTAVDGWTAAGYRNDTTAGAATVTAGSSVTPTYNQTALTYYGIYTKSYTATFYSGVNKATTTTKASDTAYYNSNSASLPTSVTITLDTAANSADIANWTELGWRDDTTTGDKEYDYGQTGVSVPFGTNFYSVYSRNYTATFYSGVNKATTKTKTSSTVYYNTNTASTPTSVSITLDTEANAAAITNWTKSGWRDDTTDGAKEYNYGATATVPWGTNFYSVYTRSYTATFYSGINKATTKTKASNTSYYNTNTTNTPANATITLDTAANSADITNWTEEGWRDDTTAGDNEYTYGQANVSVPWGTNFYSVYSRGYTANFYSGVNKATTKTKASNTTYYNTNGSAIPTNTTITLDTAANSTDISGWTEQGWRDDTTDGAKEYDYGQTGVSVPFGTNFYSVYSKDYTANFYSGVNKATNSAATGTINYNTNTTATPTTTTITLKTANDSANITNWTEQGWRDDTTAGAKEFDYGQTGVSVAIGTSNFYSVYSRELVVSYNGNGADGGSTANTTKAIYLNTNSTTTSDQTVATRANGYTRTGYTAKTPVWNKAANGSGTAVAAGANYNPALAYNASSFTTPLYAQWQANSYSIEYNLNDGAHGANHPTGASFDQVINISNPTRTGYTFTGWTMTDGDTATAKYGTTNTAVTSAWNPATTLVKAEYFKNLKTTGTVTLVANWSDSSAPTAMIESTNNLRATTQTLTLSGEDNEGINGYYFGTTKPATVTYTNVTSTPTFSKTQEVTAAGTYYLRTRDTSGTESEWAEIEIYNYTITNELETPDGATDVYTSANYSQASTGTFIAPRGTELTIPAVYGTAPEHSKEFKGWSTTYGTTAATLQTGSPTLTANNSTYYMWFNRETHTLELNSGTGISSTTGAGTYKYGKVVNIDATVATGYTWVNWTKTSGNNPANANTKATTVTLTEDTVLTANARINTSKLTVNPNGGTVTVKSPSSATGVNITASTTYTQNYNTTLTLANATKADTTVDTAYTISYNGNGGTVANLTSANTTSPRRDTLHWAFASWTLTPTTPNGTLTGNVYKYGPTDNATDVVTANYTSTTTTGTQGVITLPNATRAGYTLDGWYTSATGGTKRGNAGDTYTPSATELLYAHWNENTATITIRKNNTNWTNSGINVALYSGTTEKYTYENGTKNGATVAWSKVESGTYNVYASKDDNNLTALVDTGVDVVVTNTGAATIDYYVLTLNKGTGVATVTGAGTYLKNQVASIGTTASAGYTWANWTKNSGNNPANANSASTTVTLTQATTLTSNANANVATVTIRKDGENWTNSGINVALYLGTTEKYTYATGTENGATISWNTVEAGTYNVYASTGVGTLTTLVDTGVDLVVTNPGSATIDYYTLTLNKGEGVATVTGASTYLKNQTASINATVTSGYTWANWTKNSGSSPANANSAATTVKITEETVLTANAVINKSKLTVNPNGGAVAVTSPSGGTAATITTGTTYTQNYNTKLTLGTPTKADTNPTETFTVTYDGNTGTVATTTDANTKSTRTDRITYAFSSWTKSNPFYGTLSTDNKTYTFPSNDNVTSTLTANYTPTTIPGTQPAVTLPNATKDGYTFKGWFTETTNGTKIGNSGDEYTPAGNVTLHAQWQINNSGLTVNPNGGRVAVTSPTGGTLVTINEATTYTQNYNTTLTIGTPEKDDTSANTNYLVTYKYNDSKTADTTATAVRTIVTKYEFTQWTKVPNPLKGTLSSNDKLYTFPADNSVTDSITANYEASTKSDTTTSVTLPNPTRTGYVLNGWFTEATGGTKVGNGGATYTPTANTVLFAQWTPISYTIDYVLNGGEFGASHPTSATFDEVVNINKPTKQGYSFSGWTMTDGNTSTAKYGFTSATIDTNWNDGTTKVIAEYYMNLRSAPGTVHLTATWGANDVAYLVRHWTQNINGNAASHDATNYTMKEEVPGLAEADTKVTPPVKTYDGFTSPTPQEITVLADGTTVLDYYYTRNQYTANFDSNGGVAANPASITKYYDQELGTLPTTSYTGYTFQGWYTDRTNGTQISSTTKMPVNGATYFAHWTANPDTPYVVKHEKETLVDNVYEEVVGDRQELTGTTGETVSPAVNTYTGFEKPAVQTATIAGDGSTVITYQYKRKSYPVTVTAGTGIASTTGSDTYKFEAPVTVGYTLKPGYSFKEWTGDETSATFNMPASAVEMTAVGQVIPYTITYTLDGGAASPANPTTYNVETETFTLNNPTKEGYTFAGWTGSNGTTQQLTVSIPKGSTGNKEYVAHYTANEYDATFDSNGGTTANPETIRKPYGTALGTLPTTDYVGYAFQGWFTERSGGTQINSSTTMPLGGATYYAHWTYAPNKYTVIHKKETFEDNEYEEFEREVVIDDVTTGMSVTPPVKTYTGFTAPPTQTVTVAADGSTTVTYLYDRNEHTVTATAGTGIASTTGSGTYKYDADVTVGYTLKPGYEFKEWTGDKTAATFKMPDSNVNMTAVGQIITYSITYNLNEGTVQTANPTTYNVETETFTLNNPSKEGYTFSGWTGSNGTNPQVTVSIPKGSTGDKEFTANYTANPYTATFDSNLGTTANPPTITKPYKDALGTLPTTSRDGYDFLGWFTERDAGTQISETTTMPLGGATYYAHWDPKGDTQYIVKHEKETLTTGVFEEVVADRQTLNGVTGAKVTPAVKTYEGFTSPEPQEITIAGDGSTVLTYRYTRNTYSLELATGTGIASTTGAGNYKYGQEVSIDATVKDGYTWEKWTLTILRGAPATVTTDKAYTFNMPANNIRYTANATRNSYTITYVLNGGSVTGENPTTYTVESEPITLINPTKRGYVFEGWTGTDLSEKTMTVTIPTGSTGNRTYTANWVEGESTPYTVIHEKEKLDGTYEEADRDELVGKTGATVTPPVKTTYEGFTPPPTQTVIIDAEGTTVVTYKYTRNSYDVTAIAGRGIASTTGSGTYKYEAPVTVGYTLKNGYTFKEWTGDKTTATFTMPAQDVNMTAVGEPIEYNINLDPKGGTYPEGVTPPEKYTVEDPDIPLPNPSKEGYDFNGWEDPNDPDDTPEPNKVIPEGSTGEVTLIADYTPKNYTVHFDSNGGTTANPDHITGPYEQPIGTLPTTSYEGYDFQGWFTERNGGTQISPATTMPLNEPTYYAHWDPKGDTPYVVIHEKETLTTGVFEEVVTDRENKKTVTGTEVTPPVKTTYEGFTPPAPQTVTVAGDGSTVVTYKYTRNSYEVTAIAGRGIASTTGSDTYKFEAPVTVGYTLKPGYEFKEWTGDKTTATFTMPAQDVNMTAVGEPIEYNINLDPKGGTYPEGVTPPEKYTVEDPDIPLPKPEKPGYDFNGWEDPNDPDDTPDPDKVIPSGSTGEVTLIADYTPKKYDAIFDSNGGTTANPDKLTRDYQEPLGTLPTTSRAGYDFLGWFTDRENGTQISPATTMPLDGATYYAHWSPRPDTAYVVIHKKENLDGVYVEAEREELEGTTDTKVTPAVKDYEGFSSPAPQEVTIKGDGSTEVIYEYERRVYNLDAHGDRGVASVTGSGDYKYEAPVSIDATLKPGYKFVEWTDDYKNGPNTVTTNKAHSFTMPSRNLSYTANTDVIPYNISANLNGGTTPEPIPQTYNVESDDITLPQPSKDGYVFEGWTGSNGDTPEKDVTIPSGSIGDKEYTANWKAISGLTYTVNYLEKGSNEVIKAAKVQDGKTFNDVVNSADEVIEIPGYNYDSASVESITIKTDETQNVITLFYTKRTDLSYTVNFLEKGSNKVLRDAETVNNVTFKAVIEGEDCKEDIPGYNYDSVDPEQLTIGVSGNIINVYYVKGTFNYKVEYYYSNEIDNELTETHSATYLDEIRNYTDKVKDGYALDRVEPNPLVIGYNEDANVLKVYYEKVSGLSYTVNYLEKETNNVIHAPKTVGDMTFMQQITALDEVIEIEGYNYDSASRDTLIIGTGTNTINLYYTKKDDLRYTVKYVDKDTDEEIKVIKIVTDATYHSVVTADNEKVVIDGYNYDSAVPESMTIEVDSNRNNMILYYTKRNDLSYRVDYIDKDTDEEIHESKTVNNKTFLDKVTSNTEVIDIDGYNYDSVDPDELTIRTSGNVIKVYYTKRDDLSYVVKYLEKGTDRVLKDEITVTGVTFKTVVNGVDYRVDNIDGFNFDSYNQATMTVGTGTNELILYYTKRNDLKYTVNYIDRINNTIIEKVEKDNITFETEVLASTYEKEIAKYNLIESDPERIIVGTDASANVINIYYEKKPTRVVVKYTDIGSDDPAEPDKVVPGRVDDPYREVAPNIDGYTLLNDEDTEEGTMTEDEIVIDFRYALNTEVKVFYKDVFNGNELDSAVIPGYEGKAYDTERKGFDGYVFNRVEGVTSGNMPRNGATVTYYYDKVSSGVVERHIDETTGEVLAEETHSGNVGTPYEIEPKEFAGYKLDDGMLPNNSEGMMTDTLITVKYYYLKASKVIVKYEDANHGTELKESVIYNGYVGDICRIVDDKVEIPGYTMVEWPRQEEVPIAHDEVTYTYKYKKNSKVVANHVDKATGEVLGVETKESVEGEPYTTDSKDIQGYTCVGRSDNWQGTYGPETTTVTYQYSYNTTVSTRYVDKATGEDILPPDEEDALEGEPYDVTDKVRDIDGYTLVEEPDEKTGDVSRDGEEKIYYYSKNTKVTVKYLDKNNNSVLSEGYEIEGYEGKEYTTSMRTIDGYTYLGNTGNTEGRMSRNGDEVIYYYALDTKIRAKFIDINTGDPVSVDVEINGYEGEDYETEPVNLDDYVYLIYEGNTSGKLGETNDDVIYYYAKKTDVTVQYVDVNSNEEVDDDDKINGYEGKEYETESKDINSYILDSDSGNTEGKMARNGTTVTYFYAKECKVTIKAVDKITGEVIETTEYKGKEGDPYRVNPREISGYDLVEEELPENNEGVLTEDGETVTYYYKRKVTLRVRYLDENNNPLIDDRVSEGKEGDRYSVEVTLIDGYNLQDENKVYTGTLDVKHNPDGTVNTETLIEFHYKKIGEEKKPDKSIPRTSDKDFKAMGIIGVMSLVGLYAVVEAGKMLTLRKKKDDENK